MKALNHIWNFFLVIFMVFAGVIGYTLMANQSEDFQAGDLGLGIATSSHTELWDGLPINQIGGEYSTVLPTIEHSRKSKKKWFLLTGNSQLHAINYFDAGHHLAVYYLNKRADEDSQPLQFVQLSSPNINYQELLLYYLTLRAKGYLPDGLIVGCPYRTFQLTSLRKDFQRQLQELSFDKVPLESDILNYYLEQRELVREESDKSSEGTLTWQQQTEAWLTTRLANGWEAYRYRGNLRSKIKVLPGIAYRSFFQSKTFYQGSESTEMLNMRFLLQLIDLCVLDQVELFIYQPPQPTSDEPFPYDQQKYTNRFDSIRLLAAQYPSVHFHSFENIVPLEYWGMNNAGRLDFFHFKDAGHRLLADSVYQFIRKESHAF